MNKNHRAIFYSTQEGLEKKIIKFFEDGITKEERCIFITRSNNAQKMLDMLCSLKEKKLVLKYFSYFYIPDPKEEPVKFGLKIESLKEKILNEKFQGRVAFDVIGDISRFSVKDISNIEEVEMYLDEISNENLKLFCSFKTEFDGENTSKMIKMAMSSHEHVMFEEEEN